VKRLALWRYLWRWTLGALAVAWVALMAASYYAGLDEAEEITDAHLASAVNVLLQVAAFGTQPADSSTLQIPPEQEFRSFVPLGRHLSFTRSMAVIVWDNGVIVADSRPQDQRGPMAPPEGYSNLMAPSITGKPGHHWRIFAAQRAGGTRRAAAMIDLEQRAWIGRQVAIAIARPALVVLPLVALLLWWAIRRGLKPLNQLTARVAGLNLQSGDRLEDAHRYAEFDSVVRAINSLIDRLQEQVARERQFASDVAHELRTPLAAIALQADQATVQLSPQDRAASLAAMQQAALRAGQILRELLDLARAQSFADDAALPVNLAELGAQVLAHFGQASHESGHVLELDGPPGPVIVQGNPLLLDLAVGNLVSNALAHTRAGSRVQITVAQEGDVRSLAVSDDGQQGDPGAASPQPRPARSAAGLGLGLGLKLVERIAELHQAQLVRDTGVAPMTTRFTLSWAQDASPG